MENGTRLAEGLRALPGVTSVRARGLMVAADISTDAPQVTRRALLEQHLVINATGPRTLRFVPPLIVSEAEIADALERLRPLLA
jgi:acetylornithine/succinyldiaminopimelate/putrescine aminotransferase